MPRFKAVWRELFLVAFAVLFAGATFCCPAQSSVAIELVPQTPGAAGAADFAGLSFEMQRVLADTNENYFSV